MKCPTCDQEMKPSKTEKNLFECSDSKCEVRVATRGYKPPKKAAEPETS